VSVDKRHNILIVVVDCLGAVHVEDMWEKGYLPHLRHLREIGVWCGNAVTVCTHTSPAFASLLTGYYPPSHGLKALRGFKLNPELATMPELFGEAGYETLAWMTGPLLSLLGLDRGWDAYEYRERTDYLWSEVGQGYLKWLQQHQRQGPWLALLHLWELHDPRQIRARFDHRKFGASAYERSLHTVDELLGELLARVDLETTYVVLLGDHGENVNWRDYYSPLHKMGHVWDVLRRKHGLSAIRNGHGFHLYEDMIRIPLLIAGPGLPGGKVIQQQGSIVDVLPTCIHLTGLDMETQVTWDGVNLLEHVPTDAKRPVLVMTSEEGFQWPSIKCVRQPPWKYWEIDRSDRSESALFNLENDPLERVNLIAQERERAAAMQLELTVLLQPVSACPTATYTEREEMELRARLEDLGYL
jgi:arylsulfatase A-like enzyme